VCPSADKTISKTGGVNFSGHYTPVSRSQAGERVFIFSAVSSLYKKCVTLTYYIAAERRFTAVSFSYHFLCASESVSRGKNTDRAGNTDCCLDIFVIHFHKACRLRARRNESASRRSILCAQSFFNLHILANGFFCVENDCFCLDKRMMGTTLKVSISFHGRKAHKKHKIINQYRQKFTLKFSEFRKCF
jgi:hypothetical protein